MRFSREEGSQRSAWMAFAFWGCADFGGMGGDMMSVRMRVFCGERRRRSARSWPMKPAAPVMRIRGIVVKS